MGSGTEVCEGGVWYKYSSLVCVYIRNPSINVLSRVTRGGGSAGTASGSWI